MTRSEVLIVGAGIVGAACAFELTRRGVPVTVIDEGNPGGGTTAAGMGHVVVMDASAAQLRLTAWSRELWNEIIPQLPPAAEPDPCGTLWLATSDEEIDAAAKKRDVLREAGVASEVLDERALMEAEPNLREGLAGALLVPGDSVVYPPAVAAWLLDRAKDRGARVETGLAVDSLTAGAAHLADGSTRRADVIVDAAGNRALDLLPAPLPHARLAPRKGHLVITDRYPGFCRHQLVELGYLASAHTLDEASVAFNLQPRKTGQMLLGSSRELGTVDPSVEPTIVSRMISRAREFVPTIGNLSAIRTWTGFRPCTRDKLPLVGPVPGLSSVILACGHEGLGITTATGTAGLVASAILGTDAPVEATPYLPGRSATS